MAGNWLFTIPVNVRILVQAFKNNKIVNWQQVVQNFRLAAGGEAKMDQFFDQC